MSKGKEKGMKLFHAGLVAVLLGACGGEDLSGLDTDKGDTEYYPNLQNAGVLIIEEPLDKEGMQDMPFPTGEQYCIVSETAMIKTGTVCKNFAQDAFFVSAKQSAAKPIKVLSVQQEQVTSQLSFNTEYWLPEGSYYAFMNNSYFLFEIVAKQKTVFEAGRIGVKVAQGDAYSIRGTNAKPSFAGLVRDDLSNYAKTIIYSPKAGTAINLMPGHYVVYDGLTTSEVTLEANLSQLPMEQE